MYTQKSTLVKPGEEVAVEVITARIIALTMIQVAKTIPLGHGL